MQKRELKRRRMRWLLGGAGTLTLLLAVLVLIDRDAADDAVAGPSEPALVEPLGETGRKRVTLTASAATRLGVRTVRVRARAGSARVKAVPYSALLYDEHGRTWVYTSPKRLTFVRAPVRVEAVRGDVAVLSAGPPEGSAVAVVGAAELYGTELGVDH